VVPVVRVVSVRQVLKYQVGQYYVSHNDYIPGHVGMPCGSRILTLFLYLNDVPGGGGTRFTNLGITVKPKKGRALLWPSVLDDDIEARDDRTDHEATAVTEGVKYGANVWIHLYDFKSPNANGSASRAVQFHPHRGQFDFVWLSTRTEGPHGPYVWRARRNQEKYPPEKYHRSFS